MLNFLKNFWVPNGGRKRFSVFTVHSVHNILLAAITLLLASCSGGWGEDSADADILGPAIFGKDSTKQ